MSNQHFSLPESLIRAHPHISSNANPTVRAFNKNGMLYYELESMKYISRDNLVSHTKGGQRKLLEGEIKFLLSIPSNTTHVVYVGSAPGIHLNVIAPMFQNLTFECYDSQPHHSDLCYHSNVKIHQHDFSIEDIQRQLEQDPAYRNRNQVLISDIRTIGNNDSHPSDQHVDNDMKQQRQWFLTGLFSEGYLKFRLPYWKEGDISTYKYLKGAIILQAYAPRHSTETRLYVKKGDGEVDYDVKQYEERMYYFNTVCRQQVYKNTNVPLSSFKYGDGCYDCVALSDTIYSYIQYNASRVDNLQVKSALTLSYEFFGIRDTPFDSLYRLVNIYTRIDNLSLQLPNRISLFNYFNSLSLSTFNPVFVPKRAMPQPANIISTQKSLTESARFQPSVECDYYLLKALPSFETYLPYAFRSKELKQAIVLLRNDNNNIVLAAQIRSGSFDDIDYAIYSRVPIDIVYRNNTIHDDVSIIVICKNTDLCLQYTVNTTDKWVSGFDSKIRLAIHSRQYNEDYMEVVKDMYSSAIDDEDYHKCFNLDGEIEYNKYQFVDRGVNEYGSNIMELLHKNNPQVIPKYKTEINFGRWRFLRNLYELKDQTVPFNRAASSVCTTLSFEIPINAIPPYIHRAMYLKSGFQSSGNVAKLVQEVTRVSGVSGILHLCKICAAMWPTRLAAFMCESYHYAITKFPMVGNKDLFVRIFGYQGKGNKSFVMLPISQEVQSVVSTPYQLRYSDEYVIFCNALRTLVINQRYKALNYEFSVHQQQFLETDYQQSNELSSDQ